MIVATFNSDPSTTIIPCYNPTNTSDGKNLIAIYYEISSPVSCIPKHNVLIIGGDNYSQIVKTKTTNSAHTSQTEMGNI